MCRMVSECMFLQVEINTMVIGLTNNKKVMESRRGLMEASTRVTSNIIKSMDLVCCNGLMAEFILVTGKKIK